MKFFRQFLLVLLVLEAVSRVYLFSKLPPADRPKGWEAARALVSSGSYVCEFGGGKFAFKKPDGVCRIFTLGGSTTIGHDPTRKPWPSILSDKLNEAPEDGRRYEVINLGWWGAWSAHEFYYLKKHLYLEPDLVIVYDGYNDISNANSTAIRYVSTTRKIYELADHDNGGERIRFILFRHSALANRIRVYLYRLTSRVNEWVLRHRLFGIGGQKPLRFFNTVEWYRIHEKTWNTAERPPVSPGFFQKQHEAGRLSAGALEAVLSCLAKDPKHADPYALAKEVLDGPLPREKKREILRTLGLDRLEVSIGRLKLHYDAVELNEKIDEGQDLLPELYEHNLTRIAETLNQNRIQGLFVFQPYLAEKTVRQRGRLDPDHLAWTKRNWNVDLNAYEHYGRFAEGRRAIAENVAAAHRLYFADARFIFDSDRDDEVYQDMAHYTAKGDEKVAEFVRSKLRG